MAKEYLLTYLPNVVVANTLQKLNIIGKEKTQVAEAKGVGQTFSKVTNFYFKGLILTKSKIKR